MGGLCPAQPNRQSLESASQHGVPNTKQNVSEVSPNGFTVHWQKYRCLKKFIKFIKPSANHHCTAGRLRVLVPRGGISRRSRFGRLRMVW